MLENIDLKWFLNDVLITISILIEILDTNHRRGLSISCLFVLECGFHMGCKWVLTNLSITSGNIVVFFYKKNWRHKSNLETSCFITPQFVSKLHAIRSTIARVDCNSQDLVPSSKMNPCTNSTSYAVWLRFSPSPMFPWENGIQTIIPLSCSLPRHNKSQEAN